MKKKKKWKKILLIVLLAILFLFLAALAVAYGIFHRYYSMLDIEDPKNTVAVTFIGEEDEVDVEDGEEDTSLSNEEVEELESRMSEDQSALDEYVSDSSTDTDTSDLYNILLIGVDSLSSDFSGRSDMMMLVTINKTSKKIVVTSIMRDIYVSISGYTSNRINASYAFGGASLLISTIKQNLGITVDDYVIVNFYTVAALVDYIGGVDVSLTSEEIVYVNAGSAGQAKQLGYEDTNQLDPSSPGVVHLDGAQALVYGRLREIDSDFSRTERQRKVALAALEKLEGMSLFELDSMAQTFLPQVRTSLSESECLSLIPLLLSIGDYSIETMRIPQDGTYSSVTIRSMSVLTIDFTANYKAWLEKVK